VIKSPISQIPDKKERKKFGGFAEKQYLCTRKKAKRPQKAF
jgi:hypothetical protein